MPSGLLADHKLQTWKVYEMETIKSNNFNKKMKLVFKVFVKYWGKEY